MEIKSEKLAEIIKGYYSQIELNPSREDFRLWLGTLDLQLRAQFKEVGISKCLNVLSFRHVLLEMQGYGLDDNLKENLSLEEYKMYS